VTAGRAGRHPLLCHGTPPRAALISRRLIATGLLLLASLFSPAPRAEASIVTVPIRLDYPLLRQLLIRQLFTAPQERRELVDDPAGCNRILLSDPQIGPRGEALEIVAQADARFGVGVAGACNEMLGWRGGIGFLGRPRVEPGGAAVRIEPLETWLTGDDGLSISSGHLSELADRGLRALLGSFTLDLAPYRESLGELLPEVLPERTAGQLRAIVGTLELGGIGVTPDTLDVSLNFAIEALPEPPRAEAPLSAGELEQWENRWQTMDALLVLAVKYYASATSLQALRSALLDILIDSRYRLREALTSPPGRSGDEVRAWFLQSWEQLDPVVRRIALEQGGQEHLLWFSVLTATDALQALDRLGPEIGMEISVDGLRRLARMIDGQRGVEALRYDESVDPELQRLFRQSFPAGATEPTALRFDFSMFARARAAATPDRLNRWAPDTDELGEYLPLVAALLRESAGRALGANRLSQAHEQVYRNLVLATAWQESCWRQYVVENDKLVPLRSGSGDVGLMQINERVWRGFYDLQRLRWDIDYNSGAGAEVLLDYLVKYALPRGEQQQPGGLPNLARASYSAYNGGPGQVSRYRRSDVAPGHRKIDAAFWEKYRQVASGKELRVARCLGGEETAGASVAAASKPVAVTGERGARPAPVPATAADPGERWVREQRADHFCLQLGAFSERGYAVNFSRQEPLPKPVHVYPQRADGSTRYLVLHGSFASRAEAEPVKRKYRHLKPWLRQFGELRGVDHR
jgi:hypothetical protein